MDNFKTCFRCQKKFRPVENPNRGFCAGCTQQDMTIEWLAYGKTYLPKPVFNGKDEEPPNASPTPKGNV